LLILFLPIVASAEPMPNMLYLNEDFGECGYVWGGDEYYEYSPSDDGWEDGMWLAGKSYEPGCEYIVNNLDPDYVLDEGGSYCDYLVWGLDVYADISDPEAVCGILGYHYVGEIASEEYVVGSRGMMSNDYFIPFLVGSILLTLLLAYLLFGRKGR